MGGLLGGKSGLVNLHLGSGRQGLDPLFRLIHETEIPVAQFLPTHVNRHPDLLSQALDFAAWGGNFDLTITSPRLSGQFGQLTGLLEDMKKRELSWDRVTFSSDAGGSLPRFDAEGNYVGMGVGSVDVLRQAVYRLIREAGLPPEEVLPLVTTNPARRLRMADRIGSLAPGKSGDLVLFDREWHVDRVYCRGRLMVEAGQ